MTQAAIPASPDPAPLVAGLIGKPWAAHARGPDAFDCWGLAAHVEAALWGRVLPWSEADGPEGLREIIDAIRSSDLQRRWLPVRDPRPGDLVLMAAGLWPNHVGVWIEAGPGLTGILHATRDGGVMLQSLAQARADWARVEFRRCGEAALDALAAAPTDLIAHAAGRPVLVVVADPLDPLRDAELRPLVHGETVAEAVAGLPDLDRRWLVLGDLPLLRHNPATGEAEWDRPVAEGDTLWALPPLPMEGDRGSQVLATVLSIVVSLAAPYAAGALLGQSASNLTFGGKLLSAGIAIGANLLISQFLPPPETVAPLANPDPTYSFGQVQNAVRPGAPVPQVYGTMRRVPDLLAPPWAEFEENEQLLHLLLCLGQGEHRLREFGFGDTPVWSETEGFTGAVSDIDYELVPPGGDVTLFPSSVAVNTEVEGLEIVVPDPVDGPVPVGPFVAVPSGATATELIFDFVFPRGLFSQPSGVAETSVTWEVEAQLLDDAGNAIGFWQTLEAITETRATTSPVRLTRRYPVERGRYRTRVTRTSASTVTGTGAQDGLVWLALKAKRADAPTYPDVTALALRVRADAASTRSLQEWYVRSTRVLPFFGADGVLSREPTEAIDAAALDICTASYGLGLTEDQVDLPQLRALAATWAARGDVCCTAIERDVSAWEALELVLSAGRTKPEFIGATVTFVRDEARPASRLITPADMVRGSFEVERLHYRRDAPNTVVMRYRDRQGAMRTVECQPEGVTEAQPATIIDQVMVDAAQVWREGIYRAASNFYRRRYASWVMLGGGKSLIRGQVLDVSHPRPRYGTPARLLSVAWPEVTLTGPHGLGNGAPGWLWLTRPDGSPWGPVRVRGVNGQPAALRIDAGDFDAILGSSGGIGYAPDPRDWMVAEADPYPARGRTVALDDAQVEPTRAVVAPETAELFRCMVAEVLPGENGEVEVLAVEDHPAVHRADWAAPPDAPVDPPALLNDAAPVWDGVLIVGTEIDDPSRPDRIDHRIEGPAVPGAVRYVAEWASSVAAGNWQPAGESASPTFDGPSTDAANISIRVAAAGPVLRGPWSYYRTRIDVLTGGKTVAVPDPAAP